MARNLPMKSWNAERWSRRAVAFASTSVVAALPLVAGPVDLGAPAVTYVATSASKAYAWSLIATGEPADPTARRWMAAGEAALAGSREVALPFSASVAVSPGEPAAFAYALQARTGRRLAIVVSATEAVEGDLFVELFERSAAGLDLRRTVPARSGRDGEYSIVWQALEDERLVLRVQTVLGYEGTIEVAATESPLLAFPVSGHSPTSIQSGFGAERDGGTRAHRGVDIFASRGTEVLASLDGWVSRVDTTSRGGNVVWLQPLYGNLRLYYAHLDTQLVEEGDFVTAGDPLGTVGNTGNAITTPPHLHYGVYLRRRGVRGGARDPVDFLR